MTVTHFEDNNRYELKMTLDEAALLHALLGPVSPGNNLYGRHTSSLYKKLNEQPCLRKLLNEYTTLSNEKIISFARSSCKHPAYDETLIVDEDTIELELCYEGAMAIRLVLGCVADAYDEAHKALSMLHAFDDIPKFEIRTVRELGYTELVDQADGTKTLVR